MAVQTFTAVIHKEDDLYIADCPAEKPARFPAHTKL